MQRGATILLYHPCSPLDERQLLSALAQSCISDFILTPHKNLDKNSVWAKWCIKWHIFSGCCKVFSVQPIAFVSWGRTLEVSTAASSGICDWLNWTSSSKTNAGEMTNKGEITHKQQYHLLLTRSVEQNKHKENKVKVFFIFFMKTKVNLFKWIEETDYTKKCSPKVVPFFSKLLL